MTLTTGTVTNLAAAEGSATAQVVGQGTATIQITPEMRELLQPLQRELDAPAPTPQKAENIMGRLRDIAMEHADVFVKMIAALLERASGA